MNDEVWTRDDIMAMTMDEYRKHREYLLKEIMNMDPSSDVIPKPPPPFHFEGF
jgi:hypothetical protein